MTTDTEKRLAEIRERAEKATKGTIPYAAPFGGVPVDCCDFAVVSQTEGRETARVWTENDARFYAGATDDIPFLLAEIERLNEDGRVLMVENAGLRATVSRLTNLLDAQLGTPCEQIRHQQALEDLRERCALEIHEAAMVWPDADHAAEAGQAIEDTLYAMAKHIRNLPLEPKP